jgi:hypothetical protein
MTLKFNKISYQLVIKQLIIKWKLTIIIIIMCTFPLYYIISTLESTLIALHYYPSQFNLNSLGNIQHWFDCGQNNLHLQEPISRALQDAQTDIIELRHSPNFIIKVTPQVFQLVFNPRYAQVLGHPSTYQPSSNIPGT